MEQSGGRQRYPHLFTPGRIGGLEIRNRIVRSPCCTGMGAMDGTVTDRLIRHYTDLARGRPGLLIVEYSFVIRVMVFSNCNRDVRPKAV